MSKDYNYKRMIQSVRWQRLRKEKIKMNPLCQDCLEHGIYTPSQEVHHITPCETARSVKQSLDQGKRSKHLVEILRGGGCDPHLPVHHVHQATFGC